MSPRKDPKTTADYLATQSEAEFQDAVVELAKANGWKAYHTYDSRKSAEGFVDWLFVSERFRWTLFVELKKQTGQPTPAQLEWLRVLKATGNDARLWRPSDWPEIEAILTGRSYGMPLKPIYRPGEREVLELELDPYETDGSFQGGRP